MSDELSMRDVRIYLDGLISRDPDAPSLEALKRWQESPEGKALMAKAAERKAAIARGDIIMVSLSEPGSLRYVETDRAGVRALMDDGWTFDEKTTAWSKGTP